MITITQKISCLNINLKLKHHACRVLKSSCIFDVYFYINHNTKFSEEIRHCICALYFIHITQTYKFNHLDEERTLTRNKWHFSIKIYSIEELSLACYITIAVWQDKFIKRHCMKISHRLINLNWDARLIGLFFDTIYVTAKTVDGLSYNFLLVCQQGVFELNQQYGCNHLKIIITSIIIKVVWSIKK